MNTVVGDLQSKMNDSLKLMMIGNNNMGGAEEATMEEKLAKMV